MSNKGNLNSVVPTFVQGMRNALIVVLSLVVTEVQGQQPQDGLGLEVSSSYLLIPIPDDEENNILDQERNNALTFNAAIMWHDTTNYGRGLGRVSIGIGTGLLWWEEELLMPIYLQGNWYPFIRERPLGSFYLNRLAIPVRIGGVLGAWKETTGGQLSVGPTYQLGLRYPILANGSLWIEAGCGWMELKGPYQHNVDGVWVDEDTVPFYLAYYSIGFQF